MAEAAQSSIPSAIPAKVQPEAAADDPSVFDDIFCLGKQIQIAHFDDSQEETFRRLGKVLASNWGDMWSMKWHQNGESNCVPAASRKELKDDPHKIIPVRFRPDNHNTLYDELKIFRRKDKANKAYTYEDGFLWPPNEDFTELAELVKSQIYKQGEGDDNNMDMEAGGGDDSLGEEEFLGDGEGGVSETSHQSGADGASLPPTPFGSEDEHVDYEPSASENEFNSEGSQTSAAPRRGKKREHSPSPCITHKSMSKTTEEEEELEELGGTDLNKILDEAGDEKLDEDEDEAKADEEELSDDDDMPYKPGLYYLCDTEWVKLDHSKVTSITTGVPGNIMRYVAIQQANRDTGLQSISTLGPVFNEVTIYFSTIDPDTSEPLKITLRCADQFWDCHHPKSYYLTVSTATDLDTEDTSGDVMAKIASDSLVIHSVQSTYSNRWGWSPKKEGPKSELVGVAKFSEYTHYRMTNIYLGPAVRIKQDKQLIAALNEALKKAKCLTHYRAMHQLCLMHPVQDIWEYAVKHDQDFKNTVAFSIAATDCATQVTKLVACYLNN